MSETVIAVVQCVNRSTVPKYCQFGGHRTNKIDGVIEFDEGRVWFVVGSRPTSIRGALDDIGVD